MRQAYHKGARHTSANRSKKHGLSGQIALVQRVLVQRVLTAYACRGADGLPRPSAPPSLPFS